MVLPSVHLCRCVRESQPHPIQQQGGQLDEEQQLMTSYSFEWVIEKGPTFLPWAPISPWGKKDQQSIHICDTFIKLAYWTHRAVWMFPVSDWTEKELESLPCHLLDQVLPTERKVWKKVNISIISISIIKKSSHQCSFVWGLTLIPGWPIGPSIPGSPGRPLSPLIPGVPLSPLAPCVQEAIGVRAKINSEHVK